MSAVQLTVMTTNVSIIDVCECQQLQQLAYVVRSISRGWSIDEQLRGCKIVYVLSEAIGYNVLITSLFARWRLTSGWECY